MKKNKMSVPEKIGLVLIVAMITTFIICCATTFKASDVEFSSTVVEKVEK